MAPLNVLLKMDSPPLPLLPHPRKKKKELGIHIQPLIKDSFIDPSQIKIQTSS